MCIRDRFKGLEWSASAAGVPILDRVLGYIECRLEAEHPVGDHQMVIGRVHDVQIRATDRQPLLFFRGAYGAFGDLPAAA